jgi:putative nucleotidyltransferase with HDIG domain
MSTGSAAHRNTWDGAPSSPQQERFYRQLMSADRLPSPPELAQKMLAAVERDDVSTNQLTALIVRDQVISAQLLRMANSAFVGIRSRVTSIPHAVTLLGFARVRDIVIGLSVWGSLGTNGPGAAYRKTMWLHSAMVAAAAKKLAERAGGDGGTAFTAGLLHDVGKLVLGLRLGETYWSMLEDAAARAETTAAVETEAFGCHHGTIGGWLLQLWRLPSALVDPVALHHERNVTSGTDVVRAVAAADRLLTATDPTTGAIAEDVLARDGALAPVPLDAEAWRALYAELAGERQAIADLFL